MVSTTSVLILWCIFCRTGLHEFSHFGSRQDSEIGQHGGDLVTGVPRRLSYDVFRLHCLLLVFHEFGTGGLAF